MSWEIAGDWLAVAGLAFVSLGTGAQAWTNLGEFKSLRRRVPEAALVAFEDSFTRSGVGSVLPNDAVIALWRLLKLIVFGVANFYWLLERIRSADDEDAKKLAQFLRAAAVWAILAIGSMLVLAGAIITLVLAYQAKR